MQLDLTKQDYETIMLERLRARLAEESPDNLIKTVLEVHNTVEIEAGTFINISNQDIAEILSLVCH